MTVLVIGPEQLDVFVSETDKRGPIGSPEVEAFWREFRYAPKMKVDTNLDPFSDTYYYQMLNLHREIAGVYLSPEKTELTPVDVESLLDAPSPYYPSPPYLVAVHYQRIASVLRKARIPLGANVLDMGAGWGASSEFLASLGYEVTAIDINPKFVDLINRRSRRKGINLQAKHGDFLTFEPEEIYDAVLFYESLHHAPKPLELIARLERYLAPEGVIMLSGEPIQEDFWENWGLRLDALSIYCMRKHGWFESGWSQPFLSTMLCRSDLLPTFYWDPDGDVGACVIAKKRMSLSAQEIALYAHEGEWWNEGEYVTAHKEASICLPRPAGVRKYVLTLCNFSPREEVLVIDACGYRYDHRISKGENTLAIPVRENGDTQELRFCSSGYEPRKCIAGSDDQRTIGFHLKTIEMIP